MKKRNTNSAVRKTQRDFISTNHLWAYRARAGFTQKQVAYLLEHKTTAHVSDYEHGNRLPSFETALKLGHILRVPSDFLFQHLSNKLKKVVRQREEALPSHHL